MLPFKICCQIQIPSSPISIVVAVGIVIGWAIPYYYYKTVLASSLDWPCAHLHLDSYLFKLIFRCNFDDPQLSMAPRFCKGQALHHFGWHAKLIQYVALNLLLSHLKLVWERVPVKSELLLKVAAPISMFVIKRQGRPKMVRVHLLKLLDLSL